MNPVICMHEMQEKAQKCHVESSWGGYSVQRHRGENRQISALKHILNIALPERTLFCNSFESQSRQDRPSTLSRISPVAIDPWRDAEPFSVMLLTTGNFAPSCVSCWKNIPTPVTETPGVQHLLIAKSFKRKSRNFNKNVSPNVTCHPLGADCLAAARAVKLQECSRFHMRGIIHVLHWDGRHNDLVTVLREDLNRHLHRHKARFVGMRQAVVDGPVPSSWLIMHAHLRPHLEKPTLLLLCVDFFFSNPEFVFFNFLFFRPTPVCERLLG